MLEIRDLQKYYGHDRALNGVSFIVSLGEIVGLLGENGAGKTTLMKAVLNFLPEWEGEILLDGERVGPKNYHKLAFASSEHTFFGGLTAMEHRDFYRSIFPDFDEKRFLLLLDFFELPRHKPARSFSLGMKNQLETVLALSQGASYILMDEPFSGSDIFGREDFYRLLLGLLRPDESIILSTHLVEEVKHFLSRAVLLRRGKMLADVQLSQLEDEGVDLVDWMKEQYGHNSARVAQLAIEAREGGDTP